MKKIYIPRMAAVFTVLCICLAGTVMVSAGSLKGFFRDVTNRNGAVTGTVYENADQEINVSVLAEEGALRVALQCPDTVPYSEIEEWTVTGYRVIDPAGNTVMENEPAEWSEANDDAVEIIIPLTMQEHGTYRLEITEFKGRKKADQDLPVKGHWECTFEY